MRVFIAIDLPEELKKKVFGYSQRIIPGINVKLVEKKNLHLTLLFLGEISEEGKERIIRVIRGIRGIGGIRLQLEGMEIFPDERQPRGIWINIGGEKEKLFSLYKKIVDGLLKEGVELENRNLKFSPHITIGRLRKKVGGIGEVGETCLPAGRVGGEFMVKKITFFESKTSSKGPKYTKLGEFEVK